MARNRGPTRIASCRVAKPKCRGCRGEGKFGLPPDKLEREIEQRISDSFGDISESDEFNRVSGVTNAVGWGVDGFAILDDLTDLDLSGEEIRLTIEYAASGEQEDDVGYVGTAISGTAVAVIDDGGTIRYEEVTAEVDEDWEEDASDLYDENEDRTVIDEEEK